LLKPAIETAGQLEIVAHVISGVLGSNMLGMYLYGSAVDGGLRPNSDLDLFVVTREPLTPDQRRRLTNDLRPFSSRQVRPAEWRPIELTVVTRSDLDPWVYPPTMDFQHGEWMRGDLDAGILPERTPNADLAVLVTMVRASGQPISGPPPSDLLDPPPVEDLRRAMADSLPALLADVESDTANVLLTLARMWLTLAEGRFGTKDAAATWALDRLAPEGRSALARARSVYRGEAADEWAVSLAEARASAALMSERIAWLQSAE
jgi:streptomycin 3"-adenylyltransferase